MSILVSVIIPTHNAATLLPEAVNSVLGQSYQHIELLVVNDASTDHTEQLLTELALTDSRIRAIHLKSCHGPGGARNIGLEQARGELIAFLDADDVWLPDKILLQVEALQNNPRAGWSYCDGFVVDQNLSPLYLFSDCGNRPEGMIYEDILLKGLWIIPSGVLVRKAVLDQCGYFDPAIYGVDDWELFVRIARKHDISYTPKPLFKYRLHDNNMTKKESKLVASREVVLGKVIAMSPGMESALRHNHHRTIGIGLLVEGFRRQARGHFIAAIRYQPMDLKVWAGLLLSLAPPQILRLTISAKRRWHRRPL